MISEEMREAAANLATLGRRHAVHRCSSVPPTARFACRSYISTVEGALAPILEDRGNDRHRAACAVVANSFHLRLLCPFIWQRLLEEAIGAEMRDARRAGYDPTIGDLTLKKMIGPTVPRLDNLNERRPQ